MQLHGMSYFMNKLCTLLLCGGINHQKVVHAVLHKYFVMAPMPFFDRRSPPLYKKAAAMFCAAWESFCGCTARMKFASEIRVGQQNTGSQQPKLCSVISACSAG